MPAKNSYRAAIIGLGEIGSSAKLFGSDLGHLRTVWGRPSHAAAFSDHPRIVLAAGSSRDQSRRARFSTTWKVDNVYADWREMLALERLDVVSVCTNTPSHAEIVIAAASSGVKAIFAEKPIATSLAEADAMIEACQDNKVELIVNHGWRWDPIIEKIRELTERGVIGQLLHVDFQWARGRLACMGTHIFDLISWIVRSKAKSVMGILDKSQRPDPGGPEYRDPGGFGIVLFENGVKAFINGSEHLQLPSSFRLRGEMGEIVFGNDGGRTELWTIDEAGFADGGMALRQFPTPDRKHDAMLGAVEEIVQVLDGSLRHARCGGIDGRSALEIAMGFHVSDRASGEPVLLPLVGEDRKIEIRSR